MCHMSRDLRFETTGRHLINDMPENLDLLVIWEFVSVSEAEKMHQDQRKWTSHQRPTVHHYFHVRCIQLELHQPIPM